MPTKLVSANFLHLVPLKEQQVAAGQVYDVVYGQYGVMGTAKCLLIHINILEEIKDGVELMEGNRGYTSILRNNGYHGYDRIQVCFFSMLSRNDDKFRAMLDEEYRRMGLQITRQKELFS